MKIRGKVVYKNIATGFWGIKSEEGKEYRPINMPTELQTEGLRVEVQAKTADEGFSIFMWGTAIKIISHQKL